MIDEEGRDVESTARHIPESLLQIDGARPRPLNRNISALDRDCGIALGRPVRADLADHQKAGLRIELPPVSAVPRRPGGAQDHVEVPGRILMEIGRASGRERVCQSVWISVVAVSVKKKNQTL